MTNANSHRQIIYHDNSLSSFITGIAIGAAAALLLGTKEGRILTRKLKKNLVSLTEEIKPLLDDVPPLTKDLHSSPTPLPPDTSPLSQPPDITTRLHRHYSPSTFTQKGKPL